MAAVTISPMHVLSNKRKRAQISYAEDDDELDQLIYGDNDEEKDEMLADVSDAEEDDMNFAPTKKLQKKAERNHVKRRKITRKPKAVTPFPLLSLPRELRDEIYSYLLTDEEPIGLEAQSKGYRHVVRRAPVSDQDSGYVYRRRRWRPVYQQATESQQSTPPTPNVFVPAILRLCKQVYDETVETLYKQEFIFQDTKALHSFICSIGPENCKRITNITIAGWSYGRSMQKAYNHASLTALAACTNLRSLSFDCSLGYYRSDEAKFAARQLYRDGHHFLEFYGIANGSFDAAVSIIHLKKRSFNYGWYGSQNNDADEDVKDAFQKELTRLLKRS